MSKNCSIIDGHAGGVHVCKTIGHRHTVAVRRNGNTTAIACTAIGIAYSHRIKVVILFLRAVVIDIDTANSLFTIYDNVIKMNIRFCNID